MKDSRNQPSDHFLILITGPTAVGKTHISLELAGSLHAEIISADSRQFYKELKIGTATPCAEELALIPHHFIGNLSVSDYYNVYRFEQDALDCLEQLFTTHRYAICAGGSGLYLKALSQGIDDLPDPDPQIRNDLNKLYEEYGIKPLQEKLRAVDPDYYEKVDLANPARLIRAIEIFQVTGKPFSSLRRSLPKPRSFRQIHIGLHLEREKLITRINARVDAMMEAGLLEEVTQLMPFRDSNALQTVGYRELYEYLDGKVTLEQAIENIKTNTRRYAKRQMTWFRRQPEIEWFRPEETDKILEYILLKSESISLDKSP